MGKYPIVISDGGDLQGDDFSRCISINKKQKRLEENHVGKACKLACWFSTQSAMVIPKDLDRKRTIIFMNLVEFAIFLH